MIDQSIMMAYESATHDNPGTQGISESQFIAKFGRGDVKDK